MPVEFQTPENVILRYHLAGPGTRFVAWVFDTILIGIIDVALLIVGALMAAISPFEFTSDMAVFILIGVVSGSFLLYFLCFELFMQGQTPGKRSVDIRVVSAQGFGLSRGALFIRNVFRVIDTLPLLWFIPVLTQQNQRLGDVVAGTLVVEDSAPEAERIQQELMQRGEAPAQFTFTASQAARLDEKTVKAIEMLFERGDSMERSQRQALRRRLTQLAAEKIGVDPEYHPAFLQDLMAAYYRQQLSQLD